MIDNQKLLRRIEVVSAVLLLVLTVASLIWFSWERALGVLLGGGIIISSFQFLKWQLKRALALDSSLPSKAGLFFGYYLRYLATFFLVFLVLYLGLANPISFLIGLSVMVLGMTLVGAFEFIMLKRGES